MEKIIRQTGIAVVLVTHDESEALRLSDRIMVINGGRIVQSGSPAEVMNRPVNRFVAQFVGMETVISGTVLKKREGVVLISVNGGAIEAVGDLLPGEGVFCGIRPENVDIDMGDNKQYTNYENVFLGKITGIISTGPFLKVTMDCGFPLVAYVTRRTFSGEKPTIGQSIAASFKAAAVHLFSEEI
jgi:tungstate transport system ATP-binding protein